MKVRKGFFSGIFMSLLLCICVLFSGCTKEIEGTYKFSKMTYIEGGVQIELEAGEEFMGMMTLSEDFMTLSLNKDGTATMKVSGGVDVDAEITAGTWKKLDEKTVEITFDGEAQTCTCDGEKITIEEDGAKVVLKK